jgi:hypothetical protein
MVKSLEGQAPLVSMSRDILPHDDAYADRVFPLARSPL